MKGNWLIYIMLGCAVLALINAGLCMVTREPYHFYILEAQGYTILALLFRVRQRQ